MKETWEGEERPSGMGAGGPGRQSGHLGRGIMGTESFSPEGLGRHWSPPILDASCVQGQAGPPCSCLMLGAWSGAVTLHRFSLAAGWSLV